MNFLIKICILNLYWFFLEDYLLNYDFLNYNFKYVVKFIMCIGV